MRRPSRFGYSLIALAFLAGAGCARKASDQADRASESTPAAALSLPTPAAKPVDGSTNTASAAVQPDLTPDERYDAALLEALGLAADQKYAPALESLERARAVRDSEQIRHEIERVNGLIARQAAAEQAAQDVQTVLASGRADEAARLATAGLREYGDTAAGDALTRLKRTADGHAAALVAEARDRAARFRQEGDAALQERNLRAAAIAFEQALQANDDPQVRQQLADVRASLARYDECRQRARELRRDPANLEEAVAALQDAARAWDTLQVRQDIDEYTLALQKRRDRVSVADFEIRGDLGIPGAGRTIAEELLPAFRGRFDVVERGQLGKVLDELRLEGSTLAANESGQQEVARLARLRYLVLGSVTRMSGLLVSARLVDVKTGLIVQTAKLVVSTPEEALARLPELARLLLLTDEQKLAYEQQVVARSAPVVTPAAVGPLPPPPEILVSQPAPPPILVYAPQPSVVGVVRIDDFNRLPPAGTSIAASVVIGRDDPVKQRLLSVAVELGDNLFRHGQYREAQTHFELALNLSPGHKELALRVERCKSAPPVVVAPVVVARPVVVQPVVILPPPRPRIAVLSFVVEGQAGFAPPGLGDWAADQIAACYAPTYEIVDRGQVFWYMGRLNLSVRDVVVDISARRWLAKAMGVRYFVFGAVQQTASYNVSAHLVDAESGARQGTGMIHVQDHPELKLRMNELVKQTLTNPAEQARLQREGQESERQLAEARKLLQAGQANRAADVMKQNLARQPNNVAMKSLLAQAEQQQRQVALEESRKKERARIQAEAAAAQRRQAELARLATEARKRAAEEAARRPAPAPQAVVKAPLVNPRPEPIPKTQPKVTPAQPLVPPTQPAAKPSNTPPHVESKAPAISTPPVTSALPKTTPPPKAPAPPPNTPSTTSPTRPGDTAPKASPQPKAPTPQAVAEYTRQMQAAAAFEKQQKLADATNAYRAALRALPGDAKANIGLHMVQGRTALGAKRFADAAREFEEVLKLDPKHVEATRALQQARQARP